MSGYSSFTIMIITTKIATWHVNSTATQKFKKQNNN